MASGFTKYPEQVNLDNCATEPIHIIGKSQEHGVLLACDPLSLVITQTGTNTEKYFDIPHGEVVGKNLGELIQNDELERFRKKIASKELSLPLDVEINGKKFLLQAHFSDLNLVLDIEPVDKEHDPLFFQRQLSRILNRLENSDSVNSLCRSAVTLTREIFGYDRVMIYKFDEEWNGEVIAEAREEEMESWLGLHYPATDIPAQSRAMFLKHRVRTISNVDYQPVALKPEISPLTGEPLDISRSGLRAVSPIHIEYLKNMEVAASLTAAIIVKGKLWGLIACHHRTPKYLSYFQRENCRFLVQMLSTELELQETNTFVQKSQFSEKLRHKLIKQLRGKNDLFEALTCGKIKFTDLLSCGGGALVSLEECNLFGNTPGREQVKSLHQNFLLPLEKSIFHTRNLADIFPEAADYMETASGLLSVRISEDRYLVWFRPQVLQTVVWGGNPQKKAFYNEEKKRISPRKSFEKWSQELRGISEPWQDFDLSIARNFRENIRFVILEKQRREIELLNRKITAASQELELFSYGLSHDLRAPVRGLQGYLQILEEDHEKGLNAEAFKIVKKARRLTYKMNNLIDDILEYSSLSKQERAPLQEVDVLSLIKEILELINLQANYPKTTVEIHESLPNITGDRRMLFQLWSNLLTNALKYSDEKEDPRIEIGCLPQQGKEVFYIEDNGIGFDQKHTDKVFDTFGRVVGGEYEGSGIGLAIVKKVVEKHHGKIWVKSTPGAGSVFYFYLGQENE
ncbi:ATP-binding protein [Salinimicrobium soli]|uniref:ATP-binding protein n=1 Tax=Salinimicrobium soli TaxID=1254399 RepID=UPI003AAA3E81